MQKQIILFIAITFALSAILTPIRLYAGNDIDCYGDGYIDGQNEPFNKSTFDRCTDKQDGSNAYYDGFIDGCMSVEGNTREACESATDA